MNTTTTSKAINFLLALAFLTFSLPTTYAQSDQSEKQWAKHTVLGSVGAYQIFGLSARYEHNLRTEGKSNMAIGASAGAGFIGQAHLMPHFTYLLGFGDNKRSFLELGASLPILIGSDYDDTVVVGMNFPIGYRFQQIEGGWVFRLGLSPSYFPQLRNDSDSFVGIAIALYLITPHIGLGYSF